MFTWLESARVWKWYSIMPTNWSTYASWTSCLVTELPNQVTAWNFVEPRPVGNSYPLCYLYRRLNVLTNTDCEAIIFWRLLWSFLRYGVAPWDVIIATAWRLKVAGRIGTIAENVTRHKRHPRIEYILRELMPFVDSSFLFRVKRRLGSQLASSLVDYDGDVLWRSMKQKALTRIVSSIFAKERERLNISWISQVGSHTHADNFLSKWTLEFRNWTTEVYSLIPYPKLELCSAWKCILEDRWN